MISKWPYALIKLFFGRHILTRIFYIHSQKFTQSLCIESVKLQLRFWLPVQNIFTRQMNAKNVTWIVNEREFGGMKLELLIKFKWIETYCLECWSWAWNAPVGREFRRILDRWKNHRHHTLDVGRESVPVRFANGIVYLVESTFYLFPKLTEYKNQAKSISHSTN